MRTRIVFGLELKVFAALAAFLTIAALLLGYMVLAMQEMRQSSVMLANLSQLQTRSDSFFRRSERYVDIAPRTFPAYDRDIQVFYPDFVADLEEMGRLVEQTRRDYVSQQSMSKLGALGLSLRSDDLDRRIQTMVTDWETFSAGLKTQLGPDTNEPRLEWGTEFIRENQGALRQTVDGLIGGLRAALTRQSERISDLSFVGIGILSVLILAGLVWFYFGVTRRITNAVAGCVRVSSGDFGYQMPTQGRDEISLLGQSINDLSARARLVLTLQQRLRSVTGPELGLTALWEESHRLFNLTWLGLYRLDKDRERLSLVDSRPDPARGLLKRQDARQQDSLTPAVRQGIPVAINHVEAVVQSDPNARLARDLHLANKGTRALLVLPLQSGRVPDEILVFASAMEDVFGDEQVGLLANMTPVLAAGLSPGGLDRPALADPPGGLAMQS